MTVLTKQLLINAENLPLSFWTILIGCAGGGSLTHWRISGTELQRNTVALGLSCSVALNLLYPPGQVARSTLWVIEVFL